MSIDFLPDVVLAELRTVVDFNRSAVHESAHHMEIERRQPAAVCDRHIECLAQMRDLPTLRVAADESTIRLKQVQSLVLDEFPEPPAVAFHLPGRYRNPTAPQSV